MVETVLLQRHYVVEERGEPSPPKCNARRKCSMGAITLDGKKYMVYASDIDALSHTGEEGWGSGGKAHMNSI